MAEFTAKSDKYTKSHFSLEKLEICMYFEKLLRKEFRWKIAVYLSHGILNLRIQLMQFWKE